MQHLEFQDLTVFTPRLYDKVCIARVVRAASHAEQSRHASGSGSGWGLGSSSAGMEGECCVICMGPVVAPVLLPCGHYYCSGCLIELREKGVNQAWWVVGGCQRVRMATSLVRLHSRSPHTSLIPLLIPSPLCRKPLPPGPESLFDLGIRTYIKITHMVRRGEASWSALAPRLEKEMRDARTCLQVGKGSTQFPFVPTYKHLSTAAPRLTNLFPNTPQPFRCAHVCPESSSNTTILPLKTLVCFGPPLRTNAGGC